VVDRPGDQAAALVAAAGSPAGAAPLAAAAHRGDGKWLTWQA
jgi:hypothetical protein